MITMDGRRSHQPHGGPVGMMWCGAWDRDALYEAGDTVLRDGYTWVAAARLVCWWQIPGTAAGAAAWRRLGTRAGFFFRTG